MKLGLGCTALARSQLSGHADGIAIYTAKLREHLASMEANAILPVVFGSHYGAGMPGCYTLPLPYPMSAGMASLSGLPFAGTRALEQRIDLFHATDHHIPKLRNVPVVATIMDVIGLRHPEWVRSRMRGLKNRVFSKAATWAEHIITISEFSADDISDCLRISRANITAIPLGVDEEYFAPVSEGKRGATLKKYSIQPGYFLFIGTLQPRKNLLRLLEAHACLGQSLREAYPLVVIGQDGWQTEEVLPALARLEETGCGKWLRYVPRDDVFSILQSAHAMVFPSLYEGFGLPVLEGFASGIPVIASNTTSIPEVAGDAAILVDPMSVEAIADAMLRSVDMPELREASIAKGLARARQFAWATTAARTHAVYQSLTA
jgi:glycosyltransferase involved in cell wall biosynthesis